MSGGVSYASAGNSSGSVHIADCRAFFDVNLPKPLGDGPRSAVADALADDRNHRNDEARRRGRKALGSGLRFGDRESRTTILKFASSAK